QVIKGSWIMDTRVGLGLGTAALALLLLPLGYQLYTSTALTPRLGFEQREPVGPVTPQPQPVDEDATAPGVAAAAGPARATELAKGEASEFEATPRPEGAVVTSRQASPAGSEVDVLDLPLAPTMDTGGRMDAPAPMPTGVAPQTTAESVGGADMM